MVYSAHSIGTVAGITSAHRALSLQSLKPDPHYP